MTTTATFRHTHLRNFHRRVAWCVLALAALISAMPAAAKVLWHDFQSRLICNNGSGTDLLQGAVEPQGPASNRTLYFKFQVTPLSEGNTKRKTGTNFLAGLVFYDHGVERLGVGNAKVAWGYSAFNVSQTGPQNMTTGEFNLLSANPEFEIPIIEAARRNVPRTFVVKVQYVPGDDAQVTVWLNPNLTPGNSELNQPENLVTHFKANACFDELHHVHRGGGEGWWFRDLAVATSFDDFVAIHFWQRWWFIGLAALLLLLAIIVPIRMVDRRQAQAQIRKLEQERALNEERARIAQDLHDHLGASLTELSLLGNLIEDVTLPVENIRDNAATMQAKARTMVRSMDEIVWATTPRNDTLPSLASYLHHFAAEFFAASPIRCRVDVTPNLPNIALNVKTRHNLFLAAREALNNAAKYSQAAEVWLRLHYADNIIQIVVEDNGCGFDPATADTGRSGLRNMRERIEKLGGQCNLTSRPGGGCRVTFIVPLGADA